MKQLKAPFPWFGGKSKIAKAAWERIGDVRNAIEPFAGSIAWLLKRPDDHSPKVETINDIDCFVTNAWRAIQAAPLEVAKFADWPVSEADMHSRHRWLLGMSDEPPTVPEQFSRPELREAYLAGYTGDFKSPYVAFRDKIRKSPEYYDPKFAGWWIWGLCCWIGGGWCTDHGATTDGGRKQILPDIGRTTGRGVNSGGRVQLADAFSRGRGVNSHDAAVTCDQRRNFIEGWLSALSDRLRPVRVCNGHWNRVCGSRSTTTRLGLTGIFLDPPYRTKLASGISNRHANLYANDSAQNVNALVDEVIEFCVENGGNEKIRIAACCLEGEGYEVLADHGWHCSEWEANGGYANRGKKRANDNRKRERVWYSPHCLKASNE